MQLVSSCFPILGAQDRHDSWAAEEKHYSLNYPQFLCSRGFSKEQTYSLSSFSPFCVGLGAELYRRKCTYDQFIIIIITKLTSETLLLFCMSNPIVDVHLVSCLVCF